MIIKSLLLKSLLFTLVVCFILGCKNKGSSVQEGVIYYQIECVNVDEDDLISEVLPKTMKMYFTEEINASIIEGFWGLFKLSQVADLQSNSFSTVLKLWDKKYIQTSEYGKTNGDFGFMPDLRIEHINGSEIRAGFSCKKALAYLSGLDEPFELYYTDQIKINRPNANNPYKEINGVLLEFYLYINQYQLKIVAEKVERGAVETSVFDIPDDYKQVSFEEMRIIMSNLAISEL